MTPAIILGVALVLAGGILNGSFVAPIKKAKQWEWENSWLIYSFAGLIVVPWAVALLVIPDIWSIYATASSEALGQVLLFGFGWGLGSVLFGLGVDRMGLAVGYGIILGHIAPIGTFYPLIMLHPEQIFTKQGYALMAGTAIVIIGIFFCALAGKRREEAAGIESMPKTGFGTALLICVAAGIFSPMLNFSFVFGEELRQAAMDAGVRPDMASNTIWPLCLTAGFILNAAYPIYLLTKNKTWGLYRTATPPPSHWSWTSLMGVLCFGSFLVYGAGAEALGDLGGIVGWPLFMSMALITSNTLGALSGEWKGAPRKAHVYSIIGIGFLIVAIVVISTGGSQ
jgi:L-rhamnose-H+ transport protein